MNPDLSASYKHDFEKFLKHTDEKAVLVSEIEKYISRYSVRSVLDIGAGNGEISIPLSRKVNRYLAIEKNPEFTAQLTQGGVETVEAEFPVQVVGAFDMVLASHTISYRRADFSNFIKDFVQTAWNLVNENGVFLMIGSGGNNDDWYDLMKEIGEEAELEPNKIGYQETMEQLNAIGKVTIEKVPAYVRTETLEDMIDALTFIAGKGDPARKEKFLRHREVIESILTEKYATADGFAFPRYQYFRSIQKN